MKRAFHLVDHDEQGVTILVVACSLAFVMIALAALVIDVSALFTARGDAKQAADAAALAGAKVLANSGMTSDPTNATLQANAVALATQVATAVATKNNVGGRPLTTGEVTVSFPNIAALSFNSNPQIQVAVQRTDLPTFFARAWGTRIVPVGATAIAEAVNPSTAGATPAVPIAPYCVKPWVVPNKAAVGLGTSPIFDAAGGIAIAGLVGKPVTLVKGCPGGVCSAPSLNMSPVPPGPPQMSYYYGGLTAPSASSLPSCTTSTCDYEQNISSCSPQSISCGSSVNVLATLACGGNPDRHTYRGGRCLIHANGAGSGQGQDCVSANGDAANCSAAASTLDTQLFAGSENPLVQSGTINLGDSISNSDSLVTIPVYASGPNPPPPSVSIIGFIQGFITGVQSNTGPPSLRGQIHMTIVNVSGCGAAPSGPTIVGDGISPVPVRLIKQ